MRRLAAALIASSLLLAACSSDEPEESTETSEEAPEETTEATAEDVAALEAVTVEGEVGEEPTLTFEQPFEITNPVARVETEGTGEEFPADAQLAVDAVTYSGEDGTVVNSTWENGATDSLPLGDPQIFPAIIDVMAGQSVGSRVLFASPAIESEQGTQPALVMAIEVVGVVPTRAEGEAVEPPEGLPGVTLAEDGTPTIEIPEGYEDPTELVVQPLIEGSGDAVEAGQTVTFQYHGVTTSDGEVFDSSWANGSPFTTTIGTGAVIAGWDEGLVGQTVGSQVLLVIPPEQAYGPAPEDEEAAETAHALAGETLVFVVDILAIS
ncbi:FKBP-type peptidyl-prolyl cis-trans isomerase [Actinotalea sp. BY-33]|uniref:peptidylprolyl isomerase n=1 Tax=Actinotalea soli TaxID=2819234 RepID=A0A939RVU2_9CELL|nr:FKBP-type peptidyl-prolyl cis-trans isomerase [Actinotalea soli]MBO1751496.1 FKBP-type peptidyl-prolyl cis-trans isomerase [Actinotalea soli]